MTLGVDGHNGLGPGLVLGSELEGGVGVILGSVLVEHHGVSAQSGAGGGQGPGHGPGGAGEETLGQHLYKILQSELQ